MTPVSDRSITVPSGNVTGFPSASVGPPVQPPAWVSSMVPVVPSGAVQVIVTTTFASCGSSGSTPSNSLLTWNVPTFCRVLLVATNATVVSSPTVNVAGLVAGTPSTVQPSNVISISTGSPVGSPSVTVTVVPVGKSAEVKVNPFA